MGIGDRSKRDRRGMEGEGLGGLKRTNAYRSKRDRRGMEGERLGGLKDGECV